MGASFVRSMAGIGFPFRCSVMNFGFRLRGLKIELARGAVYIYHDGGVRSVAAAAASVRLSVM